MHFNDVERHLVIRDAEADCEDVVLDVDDEDDDEDDEDDRVAADDDEMDVEVAAVHSIGATVDVVTGDVVVEVAEARPVDVEFDAASVACAAAGPEDGAVEVGRAMAIARGKSRPRSTSSCVPIDRNRSSSRSISGRGRMRRRKRSEQRQTVQGRCA
jgi:hypothetical protein